MSGVEAVLARVLEGALLPLLGHSSSSAVFATFSAIPFQAKVFACLVLVVQSDSVALLARSWLAPISATFFLETLDWCPRGRLTDAGVALGNENSVIKLLGQVVPSGESMPRVEASVNPFAEQHVELDDELELELPRILDETHLVVVVSFEVQ